jgi:hypothetical protein
MPAERLAFGPFRLNAENGTLVRDGALLTIGQKGALILGALPQVHLPVPRRGGP